MSLQLKPLDKEILDAIAEIVDAVGTDLQSRPIKVSTLSSKQTFLIHVFAATNSYVEGIYKLCEDSRPYAAIPILRGLVEAFINTNYVFSSSNDRKLGLYLTDQDFRDYSLAHQTVDLLKRQPHIKSETMRLGALSKIMKKSLKALKMALPSSGIAFKYKKDFKKARNLHKSLYQTLKERSIVLDKDGRRKTQSFEYTYLYVYGYLSNFAHLDASGIGHFLIRGKNGLELLLGQNPNDLTIVLMSGQRHSEMVIELSSISSRIFLCGDRAGRDGQRIKNG